MSTTPLVRVRHSTDTRTVSELDCRIFSREDAKIRLQDTEWWLAKVDGVAVGFAGLRPLKTGEAYVYFTRAGVVPEARGQGLHRKLVRVRMAWARRKGYAGVLTYTVPDNTASANNLCRMGFKMYKPVFAWAGDDCLYFVKDF